MPGKMFNSYSYGGFLIFELGEESQVFIDPRSSQVYPDAFFARFVKANEDPETFESLVSQYGIGHTFLKQPSARTGKLISYLDSSPRWQRVYADATCVIHIRRP
jgi:hypothetical protein